MLCEPLYVYRGVHGRHPQIAAARKGVVIPGNENGTVTPLQHNFGGFQKDSPYTSWSYDLDVARKNAWDQGAGFVILRVDKNEAPHDAGWSWEESPDELNEQEVLLRGIRIGIEVISGG
jgi:hypothetical protein